MFAPSRPLRVLALTLAALSGLAACDGGDGDEGRPTGCTLADLVGQWRYTVLYAGPAVEAGAPGWIRGLLSVDAAGSATVTTFEDSNGSTVVPSIPPISYAIDAGCVVTGTSTVFTGVHGKMTRSKTLFVTTATQTGAVERMRLSFYEKVVAGTSFGASDVASSTFAFRQLATGVAPSWERGKVVVGPTGVYSVVDVVGPLGSKPDAPDAGTFTSSADGVVTTSEVDSFAAFLAADKRRMLATQTHAAREHRLTALVRSSSGFAQGDLAGTWHFVNLATWIGGAGWVYGTVTFDPAGRATFGPALDSTGATETPPSITLSVASDGTVTQTSPAPSVFSGMLDASRDYMIATETHEDGVYGMIVAIR